MKPPKYLYSNIFYWLECETEADFAGFGDKNRCMDCKCVAENPTDPVSGMNNNFLKFCLVYLLLIVFLTRYLKSIMLS